MTGRRRLREGARALLVAAWLTAPAAGQPGTAAPPRQGQPTAQPNAQPTAEPTAEPGDGLSPECRVPGSQLYALGELRAVKAALAAKRPVKTLAVGGTAALGASATYPSTLEAALERALPNVDVVMEYRGLQGGIASGAAERLRGMVAEVEPDLVIWQVGTNDALARVETEAFTEALDETVRWIRSHGIDVVLIDPLYTASLAGDAAYGAIVRAVGAVAAREGAPIVLRYEAMRYLAGRADRGEGHMLGRQFRLNELGLRCVAEHITRAITLSLLRTPAPPPAPPGRAEGRPAPQVESGMPTGQ